MYAGPRREVSEAPSTLTACRPLIPPEPLSCAFIDTVLAYKQRNKLGRFDPATAAQQKASKEAEAASLETQLRHAQERFQPGQRCQVEGEAQRRGAVRFVGTADFAKGVWVGIEYDEPVGKGDGR